MAKADKDAKKSKDTEVDAPVAEDVGKVASPPVPAAPASGPTTPTTPGSPGPTPRRAPGQKEVIPFKWKVSGYGADGRTLTLFKSVELPDSEAQLARLQAEGYYQGLAIYGVDDPVPQSPIAKKLQAAEAQAAKKKGDAEAKKKKKSKTVDKGPKLMSAGMLVDGRLAVSSKRAADGTKLLVKKSTSATRSSKSKAKAASSRASKAKKAAQADPQPKVAKSKTASASKTATKKSVTKKTATKKTATKKTATKKTATKKTAKSATTKKAKSTTHTTKTKKTTTKKKGRSKPR